jgi:EPS-associated MarR family transcriptional regulator
LSYIDILFQLSLQFARGLVRQPLRGSILASRREEQQAEIRLRVMRLISQNPAMSTRQVADEVGISNGSAYYVLTALVEKGFVKLGNFKKNPRKGQYAYLLTPKGIREKSLLTHSFIERKREEFEVLKAEIKALEEEAGLAVEATPAPTGASSD